MRRRGRDVGALRYGKDGRMTTPALAAGLASHASYVVTERDTASVLGSGSLPVLATPRLLAWLEAVCCRAVDEVLPPGSSSVGTRMSLEHLAASPVGATVTCRATVVHVDGRLVRFELVATRADGSPVAHGELTRVVVDAQRFLGRVLPG
jgi:fluoroacetyl-CoA thioesterase